MTFDRREFVTAAGAALTAGAAAAAPKPRSAAPNYRRIATEEAFAIPEQFEHLRGLVDTVEYDPDLFLGRFQLTREPLHRRLLDLDNERLKIMDENQVAMHLLSLTAPGVQQFDADTATGLATLANDRLAEAIGRHPTRFAGLASFAPQNPARAVREIDRAISRLKLNGLIVNSHTNGEYLSDPKYWPILEAAAALKAPIYIHPRAPSPGMAAPYREHHLEHGVWGYQAETGLHGVKLIVSGVFDRFPDLRIVLGHMGEGIPYWLYRFGHSHQVTQAFMDRPKLQLRADEYFKRNFYVTTSGVNWLPPLKFCLEVLGVDNVMWAIDYPYEQTPESVAWLNASALPPETLEKVFHRNAERVFRLRAA